MIKTEITRLLGDFDNLPKLLEQPTYLELCKYPKRRFEEICSRLLCFYFSPKKEHKLGDLFLRSLLEILAPDKEFFLQSDQILVVSEENAEGKRLDVLIYSNTFVIGIENKITAELYNPLETYKNRIQLYGTENIYRVVLSLNKLTSEKDLTTLITNSFVNLTYAQLFARVKYNISKSTAHFNEKYIHHLNDFMATIENMSKNTILNQELSDYFFENTQKIDQLITLYNEYNNSVSSRQAERIAELKELVSIRTNNKKWWAWQNWDLGFNEFNSDLPKIGIESHFKATRESPIGQFIITITSWSLKDWSYYESKLKKQYPNAILEKIDNRAFLFVETIENGSDEQIVNSLKTHFDFLGTLTGFDKQTAGNIA